MRLPKESIVLSESHPSLLLQLKPEKGIYAPVVIDQNAHLLDGYRRYQLCEGPEIEVTRLESDDLFATAMKLNVRTRLWDDIDCFLWMRWAIALNVANPQLPRTRFPDELYGISSELLSDLAHRKLLLRQIQIIQQAPSRNRSFFRNMLTQKIELNGNETSDFVNLSMDLQNSHDRIPLEELFRKCQSVQSILDFPGINARERGARLLKEMRHLRYPYYQKKSEEFSSCWLELNLEKGIQTRKNLFLEQGILELSFSARSYQEFQKRVRQLYDSLNSEAWKKIWEE